MRTDPMKRLALALLLFVPFAAAEAQHRDPAAGLKSYAAKVLPRCADGVVSLEAGPAGPANFKVYIATVRSSDKYCGTQKYLLHSPSSNQILIGTVFAVPADGRPLADRITAQSSQLLGTKVQAAVSPFPLPDGLKSVSLTRPTPFGPFAYRAYIDGSERFMIVGFRGSLTVDPVKTLREALGTSNGVRRGNAMGSEIIELSDFQCPTCARAHEKIEPLIQKNLSKVNYLRIDLPLFESHEWAVPAALGARAISRVAPKAYWTYVDHVFKNQEDIGKRDFTTFLKEFAEDNDIPWAGIEKIYNSQEERKLILDQVSRAFAVGVASTPTFIVDGQIMGFGPDGKFAIDAISGAIARGSTGK
jgi:protein-disulfide isomerase